MIRKSTCKIFVVPRLRPPLQQAQSTRTWVDVQGRVSLLSEIVPDARLCGVEDLQFRAFSVQVAGWRRITTLPKESTHSQRRAGRRGLGVELIQGCSDPFASKTSESRALFFTTLHHTSPCKMTAILTTTKSPSTSVSIEDLLRREAESRGVSRVKLASEIVWRLMLHEPASAPALLAGLGASAAQSRRVLHALRCAGSPKSK